jgi:hypothetical protein
MAKITQLIVRVANDNHKTIGMDKLKRTALPAKGEERLSPTEVCTLHANLPKGFLLIEGLLCMDFANPRVMLPTSIPIPATATNIEVVATLEWLEHTIKTSARLTTIPEYLDDSKYSLVDYVTGEKQYVNTDPTAGYNGTVVLEDYNILTEYRRRWELTVKASISTMRDGKGVRSFIDLIQLKDSDFLGSILVVSNSDIQQKARDAVYSEADKIKATIEALTQQKRTIENSLLEANTALKKANELAHQKLGNTIEANTIELGKQGYVGGGGWGQHVKFNG